MGIHRNSQDYPEEILRFKEEYAFLSNDYPAELTYEGIAYPCATSAFLASKYGDLAERKNISSMSPEKAKMKYNAVLGNPEWQEHQNDVMDKIIRLKFQQHPEFVGMLLDTGNRRLINGGKKDKYWGVNLTTWEGENYLGQILMKVRKEKESDRYYFAGDGSVVSAAGQGADIRYSDLRRPFDFV